MYIFLVPLAKANSLFVGGSFLLSSDWALDFGMLKSSVILELETSNARVTIQPWP